MAAPLSRPSAVRVFVSGGDPAGLRSVGKSHRPGSDWSPRAASPAAKSRQGFSRAGESQCRSRRPSATDRPPLSGGTCWHSHAN